PQDPIPCPTCDTTTRRDPPSGSIPIAYVEPDVKQRSLPKSEYVRTSTPGFHGTRLTEASYLVSHRGRHLAVPIHLSREDGVGRPIGHGPCNPRRRFSTRPGSPVSRLPGHGKVKRRLLGSLAVTLSTGPLPSFPGRTR